MNMKAPINKKRQWLWFAALWCSGLMATFLLSYLVRWLVFNT
jgi:hypothetical protein